MSLRLVEALTNDSPSPSGTDNPYAGRRWWDIEGMLIQQHGEGSEQVADLNQVVELTRSALYGELDSSAEQKVLQELRKLAFRLGPPGWEVIRDFDRDCHENEGWVDIEDEE